jgi:hypothetical protein
VAEEEGGKVNEEAIKAMEEYIEDTLFDGDLSGIAGIIQAEQKLAEEMGKLFYFIDTRRFENKVFVAWCLWGKHDIIRADADNEKAARLEAWYAVYLRWQKIKEGK